MDQKREEIRLLSYNTIIYPGKAEGLSGYTPPHFGSIKLKPFRNCLYFIRKAGRGKEL
jgi:hypothetical protein